MEAEFQRVLSKFKGNAQLRPEDFQFTTLNDVLRAVDKIQQDQRKTKRQMYMQRLEPFIKTMLEFKGVVEVFLNASELLAFVWGPLRFLLETTCKLSDAFDAILDFYQHIGEQIPLLNAYAGLFSQHPHMKSLLVMIYEDILSFHAIAVGYFRRSLWKQLFTASWKGFTSDINMLKVNFGRHKQLIENRASLVAIEEEKKFRTKAEADLQDIKTVEAVRRTKAVLQWLSCPNVDAACRLDEHVEARSSDPSSCSWILNEQCFKAWSDPDFCKTPLLWINGKPGAGKSVLTSKIIEDVRKTKNVSVAYFFCREGDPEENKFVLLARALLYQLLAEDKADESLLRHFEEKMVGSTNGQAFLSSPAVAKELLRTVVERRKTYLVLDGIDEYPKEQRKVICTWFKDLVNDVPKDKFGNIRCLFVSQDDHLAKKDLADLPTFSITPDHNKKDIRAYAQRMEGEIEREFGSLKDCGLAIADIVTLRSQGMFIFAKCALEEISQLPCKEDIVDDWSSDSFPKELREVYRRVYRRLTGGSIPDKTQAAAKKLLFWVAFAKRPMKWHELQGAVSFCIERETTVHNRRLRGSAKEFCGAFVIEHSDKTVEPIHKTVREFLTSEEVIQASSAELELCVLSVEYLNTLDLRSAVDPSATTKALLSGQYSFYEYAVACWALHLMAWLSASDCKPVEADVNKLRLVIEPFLEMYHSQEESNIKVSPSMEKTLESLKTIDLYESLAQAIVWSRKQTTADGNDDDHNVLNFSQFTKDIRTALEETVEQGLTPELHKSLGEYYGDNWYKCPRVSCLYFHRGFESRDKRKAHVDRHEKAYCTVDGCPFATLGCSSQKDLERHKLENHPELVDDDTPLIFPDVPDPNRKSKEATLKYPCSRCPMRFPYKYHLRHHEMSHTGQRDHVCPECRKAFARMHDLTHHMHIHSNEQFVCGGPLKARAQASAAAGDEAVRRWGCGRAFKQPNALRRHFNKVRSNCLQAIYKEMAETRKNEMERFDGKPKVSVRVTGINIKWRGVKEEYTMTKAPAPARPSRPTQSPAAAAAARGEGNGGGRAAMAREETWRSGDSETIMIDGSSNTDVEGSGDGMSVDEDDEVMDVGIEDGPVPSPTPSPFFQPPEYAMS